MISDSNLARLHSRLADAIERHIEPVFNPGVKITVVVRSPEHPDGGVVVSNDDLESAIAEIRKLIERPGKVRPAMKSPVPMRAIVDAQEVPGTGGWLITLECGHKQATRKRLVEYVCMECPR